MALTRSQAAPRDDSGVTVCSHCGDPCEPRLSVERNVNGTRRHYCCQGCAFVADELLHVRNAQAHRPASQPSSASETRCTFPVHHMVCAACALLVETRLRALPGVIAAHVDFGAQRARLRFDAQQVNEAQLRAVTEKLGYATAQSAVQQQRSARIELARLLLSWLAMMQVMMLAFPAYITAAGDIAPDVEQLLRIAQLVLTTPVMLFSAVPLLRAALNQWRARAVGMDVPIALGLIAAFGVSVWNTVMEQGAVYFDSLTMFVALVLASRWVQARALRRSQGFVAAAEQAAVQPALRLRLGADTHEAVPASALQAGDRLWVRAGDAFAADGVVLEGTSAVSQAWLMGEARPEVVLPGAAVLAGAINLEAPVVLEVTRAGEATTLAALRRLMERADEARPRVMELAQRVARNFLWVVLLVSLGTVLVWSGRDAAQAIPNALAVLIATCPCALSLAAPTVWSVAQARLARGGVLLTRVAALEALARIDTFAFDKTGTLTTPTPQLQEVVSYREHFDVLPVATALARASNHPYALALTATASPALVTSDVHVTPGQGIDGLISSRRYRLGRPEFALALCGASLDESMRSGGVTLLADERGPIALFRFGETLRAGAQKALDELRQQGVVTELLSGDRAPAVQKVLSELNWQGAVHTQLRPQDKREHIERLQRAGHCVAMMGDGLNDAPVLAQADVSFALSSKLGGAALAQTRADFIVFNGDLMQVAATVRIARQALRRVRQNFFWALLYNISVLPLAALGWLSPALAAVGMAASSLLVVGNALRVWREAA